MHKIISLFLDSKGSALDGETAGLDDEISEQQMNDEPAGLDDDISGLAMNDETETGV